MGNNPCRSSENRSEPVITQTTVATVVIVAACVAINPALAVDAAVSAVIITDPTEPSRELKQLASRAPLSQVPEMDSNFTMDQVDNN